SWAAAPAGNGSSAAAAAGPLVTGRAISNTIANRKRGNGMVVPGTRWSPAWSRLQRSGVHGRAVIALNEEAHDLLGLRVPLLLEQVGGPVRKGGDEAARELTAELRHRLVRRVNEVGR